MVDSNVADSNVADPDCVELDLRELELDRGVDVARWVDVIREQLRTQPCVRLRGCPQMLAHTLYKVGMLGDPRLELVETREEEPYG